MVMPIFLQLRKPKWMVPFPLHNLNLKDTIHHFAQILQNKVVDFQYKSSIPSRQLSYGSICNYIQAIPFEINLRQEKQLMISIFCPPSQDSGFFMHSLTKIMDHFATEYDNHLIMGDFNMEPNNRMFKGFVDSNSLTNLVKTSTCFKRKGSSIDLILTNRKYSFKYTPSYETGHSDHHHMIYIMLRSSFINIEPKLLNQRL